MINFIIGCVLGIIINIIIHYIILTNKIKKQNKETQSNLYFENLKKKEYINVLINDLNKTKSLYELLHIHKLAWAIGFKNNNLSPNKYGMFRTNDILTMTAQDVYLGNIDGLWTRTLADWSNNSKEEYQIVFNQYKTLLYSNLKEIQNRL